MKNGNSRLFAVLLILLVGTISFGCKSASTPLTAEDQQRMDRIVSDRNFTMIARWAEPTPDASINAVASAGLLPPGSSPSGINLAGNTNHLKMKGDSVFIQLPYYGARQVVKAYGQADGINYKGLANDLKVNKNTNRNYYDIDFTARDRSETFVCSLRIYGGKRCLLTVQSNQRNQIRYDGIITVGNVE